MDREIKFRGRNSEWHFGNYDQDDCTIYRHGDGVHVVIPETVGQFTGFKDVDGVEIYEGDILQNDEYPEEIGKIINENSCWLVEWLDVDNKDCLGWVLDNTPQKVIGNIHDNPELLEEKKND